jgi:1,4-alpha-glucan branching enzyme
MKTAQSRTIFRLIGVILILLIHGSAAFAVNPKDISEPQPPRVTDTGVLFSYRAEDKTPKYVKVIGDFNGWERSYYMIKNRYGVFVFMYNETSEKGVVLDEGRYRYRFLVDGIWINDPLNSRTEYDAQGVPLSYFDVPSPIIITDENPVHVRDNTYVFYYRNEKATKVYLIGDFNNWNPYSHPMKRNKSGVWEREVDILPGAYAYIFLVDGVYRKDPLGTTVVYDRFDTEYSKLTIP